MINYLSDTAIIKNKNNEACLFIIDNLRYVYSKPHNLSVLNTLKVSLTVCFATTRNDFIKW